MSTLATAARQRLVVFLSAAVSLTAACTREAPPPASTPSAMASTPPADEREVELTVDGMHCVTCPITVRTAANSVPGVVDVQVTMDPGRALVRYRPAEADPARIAAAITASGYPAHAPAE